MTDRIVKTCQNFLSVFGSCVIEHNLIFAQTTQGISKSKISHLLRILFRLLLVGVGIFIFIFF